MKKTLLALASTSALVLSGSALAAFADAPKGAASGASAQLEITGTIINTNPIWTWQIPAASQTAVTGVALKKISGVLVGENIEFPITKAPMSILEGYMKTPAAQGGPDLTPVMTIGGTNVGTTDACVSFGSSPGCTVTVAATNSGDNVGSVAVELKTSFAQAYKDGAKTIFRNSEGAGISSRAIAVLELQPGFEVTYAGSVPEGTGALSIAEGILANSAMKVVSQSRVVSMVNSKLIVPSGDLPAAWAATLPITITQK